jgi:integrase
MDDQPARNRLGPHQPTRTTVSPLFEAYAEALRRRWLQPSSIVANLIALRNLDAWLKDNKIKAGELDPLECERYFAEQLDHYQVATMRHRLSVIRAAYQYGVRHGLARCDATADVKLPRLPDTEPRTYSNDELRTIHAAIRTSREERLFYLYAYTGIRQGEAVNLRWDQIDYTHQQIKLTGKGGKFRLIPLHPTLADTLTRHDRPGRGDYINSNDNGTRLSTSSWYMTARALIDRAGIHTRAPAHTFRKTVATVMYEQGVREHVIDEIMGWAPRTVRDRHYLRIAPQTMHDAINTLYQNDPIHPEPASSAQNPRGSLEAPESLQADIARLNQIEQRLRLRPT